MVATIFTETTPVKSLETLLELPDLRRAHQVEFRGSCVVNFEKAQMLRNFAYIVLPDRLLYGVNLGFELSPDTGENCFKWSVRAIENPNKVLSSIEIPSDDFDLMIKRNGGVFRTGVGQCDDVYPNTTESVVWMHVVRAGSEYMANVGVYSANPGAKIVVSQI